MKQIWNSTAKHSVVTQITKNALVLSKGNKQNRRYEKNAATRCKCTEEKGVNYASSAPSD